MPETTQHPSRTLGDALARIDARARQAEDAVARARAFAHDLERVRGRGRTSGVEVTVNGSGLLVAVAYEASALHAGPEALARATMAALRAALADAVGRVAERARATWGDDPLADQVVAEVTARFATVTP